MNATMMRGGSGCQHAAGRVRAGCFGALALAAAGLLSACGGSDVPPVPQASATIGAAGGTLDGPDGVRVEVPAGAVTQDTVFRIARTSRGAPSALPAGVDPVPAYELTPHGIDFNLPVTISLPTPAGDAAQRQVFMASPGDSDWRSVDSASDGSRTAWQVMGFSWAIVGDACRPLAGDASACQWPQSNGFFTASPANALTFVGSAQAASIKSYRLTAAGTVDVRFNYSGAADCAGTAGITRWRPSVRDANGRVVVTSVLPVQPAGLSAVPSQPGRGQGQTPPVQVAFTASDNGEHFFGMGFTCVRKGRSTAVGGQLRLTVDIPITPATAPVVTTQPAGLSVQEPATATFGITATGTPTPTVQWERSDSAGVRWAAIPGATALSYTTPATTVAADNGRQFRAVVSNSKGNDTSQAATLIVTAAPVGGNRVIAGAIGSRGLVDAPIGPGTAARLAGPSWLAMDAAGNVYVSEDRNLDIRKITPQGAVTTLANAASGLVNPKGLAVRGDGTVYVADGDQIKAITPQGVVSVLSGLRDDRLQPATFNQPTGLAIQGFYLFVADTSNYAIKRIDLTTLAVYTVVEGNAGINLPVDGCSGATLTRPLGIAVNDAGFIFWTEENHTVRMKGECVSTLAGLPASQGGYADGVGSAALFNGPLQLSIDSANNLYVADFLNSVVRKVEFRSVSRPARVTTVFGVAGDATTAAGPNGRIAYPIGVLSTGAASLLVSSNEGQVVMAIDLP